VVAIASLWLPPFHDHRPPYATSALAFSAYLATAAVLGRLVSQARKRAASAEVEARSLASDRAALRRVATLIGAELRPERVFGDLTQEMGELLHLDLAALVRFETDGSVTVAGRWSRVGAEPQVSVQWASMAKAMSVEVRETGRAVHIQDGAGPLGSLDVWMGHVGAHACIAGPVVVRGGMWGVMVGASVVPAPLAPGTERRLEECTQLAATAIANACSRHELAASTARIMTSSHQARQRIERDLHDGVQQRLVSLALDVRRAEALAELNQVDLRERLSELRAGLVGAVDELREVARGIHPSILTEGGLKPALARLARRSPIPVELTVRGVDRGPEAVEVCVYYVASEALTNALKHAHATAVFIDLELVDGMAHLLVRDDGVGGADVRNGSGLIGMIDRLQALDGTIELRSPASHGTCLEVHVPWIAHAGPPARRTGSVYGSFRARELVSAGELNPIELAP
jgi:signal transduction histidine kinase